jgi:HK97 family phage major capsid protein
MENRMVGGDKKNQYSFTRALKNLMQEGEAGFEREISRDAEKRFGTPMHGGLLIPLDLPIETRAGLVTNTNSAGGFTVQTTIQPLIELLRNQMVVRKAGATIMEGLRDTIAFPKQLTPGTANWVAENPGSDNTDADLTLGQITMSPKMLTSTTGYSRKSLAQSSLDIEAIVSNDLIATSAIALDLASLIGTGSSNQPAS